MVPITDEQNIICSKTRLDGTTHEQTIVCRQLFAGHVVDSRPMEREEKTHRMINSVLCIPERRGYVGHWILDLKFKTTLSLGSE